MASLLHHDKRLADIKLEGIAIGNGFLDPETMLCYGDFLYQTGLVDNNTKQEIIKLESQGRKAIHDKHYVDAFYVSVKRTSTHIFIKISEELTQFNDCAGIFYIGSYSRVI